MGKLAAAVVALAVGLGQAQAQSIPTYKQVTWHAAFIGFNGLPSGGLYWLTDFPSAPGTPDANDMTTKERVGLNGLPCGKVFIVGARIRSEAGLTGQVELGIDHENRAYSTGTPPAHQAGGFDGGFSDNSEYENLASLNPGAQEILSGEFWPPKVWNRTGAVQCGGAGTPVDRIWLEDDAPNQGQALSFDISFLVPNSDAVTGLVTPPPPPPGTWQNSAGPVNLASGSANYGGEAFCLVIQPSAIASLGAATETGITLQAGTAGAVTVTDLYAGPSAGGSNPCDVTSLTQFKFAGASGVVIPAGGTATATANVDLPAGTGYVIKGGIASGYLAYANSQAGFQNYAVAGDPSSTPSGVVYSQGSAADVGVEVVQKLLQ